MGEFWKEGYTGSAEAMRMAKRILARPDWIEWEKRRNEFICVEVDKGHDKCKVQCPFCESV